MSKGSISTPFHVVRVSYSSTRQTLGELQDFADLRRAENAANPLRMKHRERRVDEVFFLHLFTVDDEALEQVQELQLAAGQVAVLADELVKAFADRFREAF